MRVKFSTADEFLQELYEERGQVMDSPTPHEPSNRVKAKAEIIRANIEAKARDLALEIRAGMFAL